MQAYNHTYKFQLQKKIRCMWKNLEVHHGHFLKVSGRKQWFLFSGSVDLICSLSNLNKICFDGFFLNDLRTIDNIYHSRREVTHIPDLSLTVTQVKAGSRNIATQVHSFQESVCLIVPWDHGNKRPRICNGRNIQVETLYSALSHPQNQ